MSIALFFVHCFPEVEPNCGGRHALKFIMSPSHGHPFCVVAVKTFRRQANEGNIFRHRHGCIQRYYGDVVFLQNIRQDEFDLIIFPTIEINKQEKKANLHASCSHNPGEYLFWRCCSAVSYFLRCCQNWLRIFSYLQAWETRWLNYPYCLN